MDASQIINSFSGLTALVVGDVMVDSYIWGVVERMSPEAPVPVVSVREQSSRLGGAANVAKNIRTLGANAIIASVVGQDLQGEQIAALLEQEGISRTGLVHSNTRKTTVKTRVISDNQHIVRVDEEETNAISEQDAKALLAQVVAVIEQCDVLILEDYNKGILSEVVITELIRIAKQAGVPIAVDPKKKNFFCYQGVQLFKPNLKELREGMELPIPSNDQESIKAAAQKLREKLSNTYTLVTLSENGVFVDNGVHAHFLPAHDRSIVDVSGAGDSAIATAALCLASKVDPVGIATLSNLAGGIVCEYVGVVPIKKEQLKAEAQRLLTNK